MSIKYLHVFLSLYSPVAQMGTILYALLFIFKLLFELLRTGIKKKYFLWQFCVYHCGFWKPILMCFKNVRKIAKSGYELRHVYPSVRVEQLGSHWTEFHEKPYLRIFRKSV